MTIIHSLWFRFKRWIWDDFQPPMREKTYNPKKVLTSIKEFEKGLAHIEEDLNDMFDDLVGSQSK